MTGTPPLPRVGIGLDVHAFGDGRRLVLGGVEVPHERGLAGHSDGDVLTHAVIDALLGAAALGDIGGWFPSDDPRWSGADSIDMVRAVSGAIRGQAWVVGNVDATIVAQQPRLGTYLEAMRERLAEAIGVSVSNVSVKATTTDHLGALGRAEGIAAQAVAIIVRS